MSNHPRPKCMECSGTSARLVSGKEIYPHRPDLYDKVFYKCPCGAYCGCHPNTTKPLGYPCGPKTRSARNAAHRVFDPLWKNNGPMTRSQAYKWLAAELGIAANQCHIGMMSEAMAKRTYAAVMRLKEKMEGTLA